MRPAIFSLLVCLILAACATEDIAETGIPKARAIAIATHACKDYPARFPVIDRAQWISSGRYWVVDLTDPSRSIGKFYMIDRHGQIIGTGRIPQDTTLPDEQVYRGRVYY